MADVKWIKVATKVFDNRKIRQIEKMPEGDTIIVIWFKLLCLAGNINDNGMIYFTEEMPYTDEMLATEFNRPTQIIKLALNVFQKFKMIELIDDVLYISSWEKYQNIEGLEKIREQTKKRVAKHRELKALEECNVTSNVTVTQGNATDIELELDIDKDIDKDKDINNNTSFQKQVFGYWVNKSLNNSALTKHTKLTKDMDNALKSIKKLYSVDKCKELIDRFCIIFEEKKNTDYPLKKRTLQEFFGQKAYQSKSLICQEFDDEGCKWINHKEDEPIDYFELVKKAEEARRNG